MGLRARAGIAVAIFVVSGSLVGGSLGYRHIAELTHEAALERGSSVLNALSVPAAVAIATNDYPKLDNFITELVRNESEEILLVIVVDNDGHVMATSRTGVIGSSFNRFGEEFTRDAILAGNAWFQFGPDPLRPEHLDISRPIDQGRRWGTILARFSLASLEIREAALKRALAWITVAMALGSWLIAVALLNYFVLTPTEHLASMANQLGSGQLDVRSPLRRDDEIGDLSEALNRMAEQLKQYTTGLENLVHERTAALEIANRSLAEMATTDSLTGLKNYRFFRNRLEMELRRSTRHPSPLCLCMLDLDWFKTFNDTFGHQAGDRILHEFGKVLESKLRSTDLVARYGGEEFAVVLLDTAFEEGLRTAEKLCRLVDEHEFPYETPERRVTVSIGIAAFPSNAHSLEGLIEYADRALYEAKRRGRNCVVPFTEDLLLRSSFAPIEHLDPTQGKRPAPEEEAE